MKKSLKVVCFLIGLFLICTVLYIANWRMISDCRYSKQLVYYIKESNVEEISRIVKNHPNSINTRPTNVPLWIRKVGDVWAVYYPLQEACKIGNYEVVELLINSGAEVNIQDDLVHDTPLIICVNTSCEDKYKIAELLLDHGADPLLRRSHNNEFDALGSCIMGMMKDTPEKREEGRKVFERMLDVIPISLDGDDVTALFEWSIYFGNFETTKCILSRFDIPNERRYVRTGESAYDYAVRKGYIELADLLE